MGSEFQIELSTYESPHKVMGQILLAHRAGKLISLDFSDFYDRFDVLLNKRWPNEKRHEIPLNKQLKSQLDDYFKGDFDALDSLEVETAGTDFQKKVWQQLRHIPTGETWTYGQLAQALGKPTASRAVGRTNGLNPIALVLPCHRVIGGNGKLTGYAGGLPRKEWLLNHENVIGF